jgi:N-methylhydantoinase B
LRVEPGDVVSYYSPGGGGYGDPLERDPAKVLDDVLDEFITVEHAEQIYGVLFDRVDDGYGYAVDASGTAARRAELRARREWEAERSDDGDAAVRT